MKCGCVYLVGAGPGDPDLLTVKALRLLRGADVVVLDRLVSGAIEALIPVGATRIHVGKAAGHHHVAQDDINALLARLARSGRDVVRLKGGDPFIFGRGGEEAEYLARRQIRFEVVPGITAAAGCSAYGGIPLTHRDWSSGVRIITGHARQDGDLAHDWHRLAAEGSTLVVYMGLATLDRIAGSLMAAGLSAETPAAAIENGTTNAQRRVVATLATLAETARGAGFRSPTLIIIGQVVQLAGSLDWFATPKAQPPVSARPERRRIAG